MTIFPPVGPVLGPRHHSHPRDGAQMLSKGPQRKTRVRTDLYTQKVKFCNFCCFLNHIWPWSWKGCDPVTLCSTSKLRRSRSASRSPGRPRRATLGKVSETFFVFFALLSVYFFALLSVYLFCIVFLYCFLIAFFVLFFLHFFLWIVFLHCFFFIAFFVLLSSVKVREQFNGITAFLDMSAIYASDEKWQKAMRQTEFHVKTCLCEERRCIKKRLSRRCPGTLKVI